MNESETISNESSSNFMDTLTDPSVVGYMVFGILSIIAIVFIVKFSIEIDRENYKKQMMTNNENYQTTLNRPTLKSPHLTNARYSVSIIDQPNTSFTSNQQDYYSTLNNRQLPYNNSFNNSYNNSYNVSYNNSSYNNNNSADVLIPPRRPTTPNAAHTSYYGHYRKPSNQNSTVSYNNRQSRQHLLQNY